MGMVPEAAVAMLACARLGAPHTVVFGGFAADALRDRINDCQAKVLHHAGRRLRRGNVVPLKDIVDQALAAQTPSIEKVRGLPAPRRQTAPIEMKRAATSGGTRRSPQPDARLAQSPRVVDAEHPLFILYTSGSTGKPKGVLHTTAGYLAGAHLTTKYVFDLRDDDVYWCTADVGWVTGHSYVVYGPLSNGATCLMYEGAPNFPDWGRFWQIIEQHRVTILYTAPTAIRAFMRGATSGPQKHDLSSLRLLGTRRRAHQPRGLDLVPRAHRRRSAARSSTPGGRPRPARIMMTTLPGASLPKPGSTGLPFFGVVPEVVDRRRQTRARQRGRLAGHAASPGPRCCARSGATTSAIASSTGRDVPGAYFTGDGARRDEDGYFWVVGRIDDVLNVAGHRIGTAEIESALVSHPAVAEAAAVGPARRPQGPGAGRVRHAQAGLQPATTR